MEKQREIFLKILKQAESTGWNEVSFNKADNGYRVYFPQGVKSVLRYFVKFANEQTDKQINKSELDKMGLSGKIKYIYECRVKALTAHKGAIKKLVSLYKTPKYIPIKIENTYNSVDYFWKTASDESIYFDYYTKRASLAGIYVASQLYWINHSDEDAVEFFAKRIDDWIGLMKKLKR